MSRTRFAIFAAAAGIAIGGAALAHSQTLAPEPSGHRQDGRGPSPGGHARYDCSRAPNPAKCDARRKEFRAELVNAQNACEDKHGEDHHACMIRTMCQQARDPQQCETIARRRAEHRQEIREACAGKAGDELRNCVRNRIGYEEAPLRPGAARDE
jgi:hypothetical protein